jgi:decaprenyl-phosphate phosphoribosyltransferase
VTEHKHSTNKEATVTAGEKLPRSGLAARIALLRPKQWSKSGFVLLGPLYGYKDLVAAGHSPLEIASQTLVAVIVFALASSGCYVVNDLMDRERDRLHPRKRRRPIASGAVSVSEARIIAVIVLLVASLGLLLLPGVVRAGVGLAVGLYIANVMGYSFGIKRVVMLDVISLASGFVLRMIGGCLAVGIAPSTWLLNVCFFLAMYLAFGKRLGERRTMGSSEAAVATRRVQAMYSDDTLRMVMVATAVVTLVTYAGYVQDRAVYFVGEDGVTHFNWLWLSMLPATFGLFRSMLLVERGDYDDPTELATRDWPFQLALVGFGVISGLAMFITH